MYNRVSNELFCTNILLTASSQNRRGTGDFLTVGALHHIFRCGENSHRRVLLLLPDMHHHGVVHTLSSKDYARAMGRAVQLL